MLFLLVLEGAVSKQMIRYKTFFNDKFAKGSTAREQSLFFFTLCEGRARERQAAFVSHEFRSTH